MRWVSAAVVTLAACGRVGFRPIDDRDGALSDGDGVDSSGDGSSINCPSTYVTSFGSSRYRVVGTVSDWPSAESACEADGPGSHLAVFESAAELMALGFASGFIANWGGVSQRVTAGTWLGVTGSAATFLPWDTGYPVAAGGADCIEWVHYFSTGVIAFQNSPCNMQFDPVCECDGVAPDPSAF